MFTLSNGHTYYIRVRRLLCLRGMLRGYADYTYFGYTHSLLLLLHLLMPCLLCPSASLLTYHSLLATRQEVEEDHHGGPLRARGRDRALQPLPLAPTPYPYPYPLLLPLTLPQVAMGII